MKLCISLACECQLEPGICRLDSCDVALGQENRGFKSPCLCLVIGKTSEYRSRMYSEGIRASRQDHVLRGAEGTAASHEAILPWRSLVTLLDLLMTSEGARRAPCTDCETVIRQSAVVPQHRMEGDVPETVGERAAAVHSY